MDTFWIAFYRFGTLIGVKQKEDLLRRLDIMERIAASVGFWYPRDGICIVSDRFAGTHWDEARNSAGLPTRLHRENGPAVHFRDGWGLYYWHGTRVPAHWIEQRDKLDPNEVLKAQNVEQRAAGIAIIGMLKMLDKLPHKIIDSHPDPQCGDLIEISLPGLQEPELYLKFLCPRNGDMMEAVNKRELGKVDLHHAHAWHARVPARLYSQPKNRS